MQVTITEHNDNEGESFSYIFNVMDEDILYMIKEGLEEQIEDDIIHIEENSDYSEELVKKLNKASRNSYMVRYEFYNIPDISKFEPEEYYNEIFYKAVGLEKVK